MLFSALLAAAGASLAGFLLLWPPSLRRRDSSLADLWWGAGFAAFFWTAWALGGAPTGAGALALLGLVTLWSLRIQTALTARRLRAGGEDPRYAALREAAGPSWPLRSLFQVFVLQGVLQAALAAPIAAAMLDGRSDPGALAIFGGALALFGLGIETAADRQLDRWQARGGTGLMRAGLRSHVRHPNYAGEVLFWTGLATIAADLGAPWAFVTPAALFLLLDRVSGRPPLEERLARHPGWEAYAARTPAWAPRLAGSASRRNPPGGRAHQ